jgi:prepilin-type N-terminal cleavage/methylation domain-containing protein
MENKERGMSIIEVMLAVAIFVLGVASISLMYLNSVTSSYISLESSRAVFLAQEGLEAVKAIRDNDINDLSTGTYGLDLSGDKWILSEEAEEVLGFSRSITISNGLYSNFIIRSKVVWQDPFSKKERELELVEKISDIY